MSQELFRKVLMWVFILIVLAAAAFLLLYVNNPQTSLTPFALVDDAHKGNFESAIQRNQEIQNDPSKSATEKAIAQYSSFGMEFRITGDMKSRLADVQKMKEIVLNPEVAPETRANALNVLAEYYSIAGGDKTVFNEIFKDAPFNTYLVENQPTLSSRKLAEWSYSLYPTSNAAIDIASWYTEQPIFRKLSATTSREYIRLAEDYMQKADAASAQERKNYPSYEQSSRYLAYRYWRTLNFLRLATQKGEPYQSQYMDDSNKFIQFAQSQDNYLAKGYIMFDRFFTAGKLRLDKRDAEATAMLDQLAADIDSLEKPQTDTLVRYCKNALTLRPNSLDATLIRNYYTLSPKFQTAIEKAMATIK